MNSTRRRSGQSEAFCLMVRPAAEYADRVAAARDGSWTRALRVPGLLILLLGIVTAVATTGRVVASLVISHAVCWSFVPLLQLGTGSILIGSAPHRPVMFPRAVELLFAAQGPWSLWLAAMGVLQTVFPDENLALGSSLIPFTWTGWIRSAYGREVLGLTPAESLMRVLAHQGSTAVLILTYMELGSGLSVRLIGVFQG